MKYPCPICATSHFGGKCPRCGFSLDKPNLTLSCGGPLPEPTPVVTHTITLTIGANGTCTHDGAPLSAGVITVAAGSSYAIVFVPTDPIMYESWYSLDSEAPAQDVGYTFVSIAADHTLDVTFELV